MRALSLLRLWLLLLMRGSLRDRAALGLSGKIEEGQTGQASSHLERVRVLQENLPELARFTGIEAPVIVSALFVSGVVPMQYAKIDALKDAFVGGVDKFLSQQAN